MTIARRKIIGLFAASAATALAGCGGGDSSPLTRLVWLLNLNPEFPSADVSIGSTFIATALPFPGLTSAAEVEYGSYTIALREQSTGVLQSFDGVLIDDFSPSMFVFYRHFTSTRLGSSPPGIINYFDSTVPLDVDLYDDAGNVQLERLEFEGGANQHSASRFCTLRLYAAGSTELIYDSGTVQRTDSILIFPRYPAASPLSGQVAVIGLNYGPNGALAVSWDNLLG